MRAARSRSPVPTEKLGDQLQAGSLQGQRLSDRTRDSVFYDQGKQKAKLVRDKNRDQCRNDQPQKSLHQEEDKPPKAEPFYPTLYGQFERLPL